MATISARPAGCRECDKGSASNTQTMSTSNASPSVKIEPYLFFEGRCEEALEFYRRTLGAQVTMMMRFREGLEAREFGVCPPQSENKVMNATVRIGATTLMASDGCCSGKPNFQGFSLCLELPTAVEARRVFNALAEGGQVQRPLDKTFFAPLFGMVADRFGVSWMVLAAA